MKLAKFQQQLRTHAKKVVSILLVTVLMSSVIPMNVAFANPSAASLALTNAQQYVNAISGAANEQAAIVSAVGAVNEAIDVVNALVTQAGQAIDAANLVVAQANTAVASVTSASSTAEAALLAALPNETLFNDLVDDFIDNSSSAAGTALVALTNAASDAWTAFAILQNAANTLANNAILDICAFSSTTGPTVAQIEAAIALAVSAQASADALLQAWLDAEDDLAANIDGALAAAAADRLQTRNALAAANKAAVEELIATYQVLLNAQVAYTSASELRGQAVGYLTQLNQIIEDLMSQSNLIINNPTREEILYHESDEYTFRARPPGEPLPPGNGAGGVFSRPPVDRIDFGTGGVHVVLGELGITQPYLISIQIQVQGGEARMQHPNWGGNELRFDSTNATRHKVIYDLDGFPKTIASGDPHVRIMITVTHWIVIGQSYVERDFWVTGTFLNNNGGTIRMTDMEEIDRYKPLIVTRIPHDSITQLEIDDPSDIPALNSPPCPDFRLEDLFMGSGHFVEPGEYPSLSKAVNPRQANLGEYVTYTLVVNNTVGAEGVFLVRDDIDPRLRFVPDSLRVNGEVPGPAWWSYNYANATVYVTFDPIPEGNINITFEVEIYSPAAAGLAIPNTAYLYEILGDVRRPVDEGTTDVNVPRIPLNPRIPIEKTLRMPLGTVVPTTQFNFLLEFVDVYPARPATPPPPVIANRTFSIPFTQGMATTPFGTNYVQVTASYRYITFPADIMPWHAPGFYTFRVTEILGSSGLGSPTGSPEIYANEDNIVIYDQSIFYILLLVGWLSDDCDELVILYYRAYYKYSTEDCDEACHASHTSCEDCDAEKHVPIQYLNRLVRRGSLDVEKLVQGNFGNAYDFFNFRVQLTLPEIVPAAQRTPIIARIHDRDGVTISEPITINASAGNDRVFIHDFDLRHGDFIRFTNVPYGTTYIATEHLMHGYDKHARVTEASVTREIPQVRRRSLVIDDGRVAQRWDADAERIYNVNHVLFVNYRNQNPPMGVLVDNAPFIGLIVLAAASGVVGIMRLRKRDEEETFEG